MLPIFGPGSLYVTRTDIATPTPINIGFVQSFNYDEAAEQKDLYGQNQYALASARGTIKATGKAKAAVLSGLAINALFHGDTFATRQIKMAEREAGTVPGTPYQVTVTNSATFETDLGVINATTGLPLTKVASSPATGQYSVSAGVYTFASADTTVAVLITYAYTVSGSGQKITVTNKVIGSNPTFQLDFSSSLNDKPYYVRFFCAISPKLSMAHGLTDFAMPEVDFSFYANAAGNVYQRSFPEVS